MSLASSILVIFAAPCRNVWTARPACRPRPGRPQACADARGSCLGRGCGRHNRGGGAASPAVGRGRPTVRIFDRCLLGPSLFVCPRSFCFHQKRPQALFGATLFPCAMFLGCRISKIVANLSYFSPFDLFFLATRNSGGGGGTAGIGTGGFRETGGAARAFAP